MTPQTSVNGSWSRGRSIVGMVVLTTLALTYYNMGFIPGIAMWMARDDDPRSVGHLVSTEGCIIPEYDARDPSIAAYLEKPAKLHCNPLGLPPLTYTFGNTVRLNTKLSVLLRYHIIKKSSLSCCVKEVHRIAQTLESYTPDCDDKYKLSDCLSLDYQTGTSPNLTSEGALVTCTVDGGTKPVYKNVHYFFPREKVKRKIQQYKKRLEKGDSTLLNFMIVGIDSTSRQNMKRYLPKTYNYLSKDVTSIDFMGYNKVADNTDPNISPIIMGIRAEDLNAYKLECFKHKRDSFDDCPFIWKEFSAKGYVTVYAEDAPEMGLYHFRKVGFVEQPTDYYNRPSFMVSEKEIGHIGGKGHWCQGLQTSAQVIYGHALRALDTFAHQAPVFGYFWTASTTHDNNENAAMLDEPTLKFLKNFKDKGFHNNTILLFISDHGMRFGGIRSTYLGALEERLPFIFMIFPPWFAETYPQTWKNLLINRNKLINNYDLHLTVKDILHESYLVSSYPKTEFGVGQSLFLEVSSSRTCESILIPTHYCTCQRSAEVAVNDAQVLDGANFIVKAINDEVAPNKMCSLLKLEKVLQARVTRSDGGWGNDSKKQERVWLSYMVTLQTEPGGGVFEATILLRKHGWALSDAASRVSLYGNQSSCVDDPALQKYCYCIL